MRLDIMAGFLWLLDHWYWWLAYIVISYLGWYFLAGRRIYKMIDGKVHVKHGALGKWLDVERHMREEHDDK
jgi:hypothetical protein